MRAKEGEGGRIRRRNKEKKRKEETGIIHGCSVTDDAGFFHCHMNRKLKIYKTCVNDFNYSCKATAVYTRLYIKAEEHNIPVPHDIFLAPRNVPGLFSLAAFMLPQAIRSS